MQCVAACCSVSQCVASINHQVPQQKIAHLGCTCGLQRVAVCCRVSLRFAVFRSVSQCIAVCCIRQSPSPSTESGPSGLQCVAACCSVLQCFAVFHSASQCVASVNNLVPQHEAAHLGCRVLQRVAACCSVSQCIAVYCSVLHPSITWSRNMKRPI